MSLYTNRTRTKVLVLAAAVIGYTANCYAVTTPCLSFNGRAALHRHEKLSPTQQKVKLEKLSNAIKLGNESTIQSLVLSDNVNYGKLKLTHKQRAWLDKLKLNGQFIDAVNRNDIRATKELLRRGANINARQSEWGNATALMTSVACGYEQLSLFLINKGADVRAKAEVPSSDREVTENITALTLAAGKQELDVVNELLTRGADPNVQEYIVSGSGAQSSGRREWLTPLLASMEVPNNPEVAELLVKHGANPNVSASDGVTPLMGASIQGNSKLIELLLSHGADPMLKDSNGKTALDYAHQQKFTDIARMLQDAMRKHSNQKP